TSMLPLQQRPLGHDVVALICRPAHMVTITVMLIKTILTGGRSSINPDVSQALAWLESILRR
ncbi:hypothetical protein ACVXHA_27890, partial [Escherichia coli]